MKKLAILFLLTVVIVSFTFAQVSLQADFSVANINKGNTAVQNDDPGVPILGTAGQIGYADPVLTFIFAASKTKDLGPGKLGFEGALGIKNSFHDTDYGMFDTGRIQTQVTSNVGANYLGGSGVAPTDDTYAGASYFFGAGPGDLGFFVNYKFNGLVGTANDDYMWTLEPGVKYANLNAGPVTLAFWLLYDYKFNGISTDNSAKTNKGAAFFRPYGDAYSQDQIQFGFDIGTGFGLGITYKFNYGWGKDATGRAKFARNNTSKYREPTSSELQGQREITNIAYLDVNYALNTLAKVGLIVDDTGPGFRGAYVKEGSSSGYDQFNTETRGFTLKPYAKFAVQDLGFGLYLTVTNIMPTNVDEEVKVKPGVWVQYTL